MTIKNAHGYPMQVGSRHGRTPYVRYYHLPVHILLANPCRRMNIGRISRTYLNTIAAAEPSTQTNDIMRAPNRGRVHFFSLRT